MAPRGYPVNVVKRAREMHEAGWTCTEISRLLESEVGLKPDPTTIRKWVDPDYAEVLRARRSVGGAPGPNREKAWQLRHRRMRELRELGLSFRNVAALMSHDFKLDLTQHQVENILSGTPHTNTIRRLLWPETEPQSA